MYKKIKRILDVVFAGIMLVLVAIPSLIVAVMIKIDSKGPVLFKQQRLGMGGKLFTILKLRSMVVDAEHTGSGVYSGKNDSRVTKIGRFLRATSIDELPQLLNILKGEMSFIGDREIIGTTKKNLDFTRALAA